uniref:amino acid ABC transporter substrate-binding protein n=1 Tax=Castellaniella defragrans TaxID=75697 RepID=UPI00333E9105
MLAFAAGLPLAQADTLAVVKDRGVVRCGVTTGFAGFSAPDTKGNWQGLDVDMCRAVAAAVLGDASKVKVVPLNAQQRFTALQSGEIDLLARNTTVTLTRDTGVGAIHAAINFYDGQGFLVPKSLGLKSAKEINGATVCMQTGTSNENTMADWARANGVKYTPVVIEQFNEVVNAFASGRCDVFTTDASGLASIRISKLSKPDDYQVLPEIISKEPLGPFVRQGDDVWLNIVKWSFNAMTGAEELGLTSANVDQNLDSANPNVRRLLGVTPGAGKDLGVDEKWAYNIIKQVGNYGESFERNVGMGSPLKIQRGLNALWTDGGLMYPLPVR